MVGSREQNCTNADMQNVSSHGYRDSKSETQKKLNENWSVTMGAEMTSNKPVSQGDQDDLSTVNTWTWHVT